MTKPEEVLEFWLDEVGEGRWYNSSPDLDAQVRNRFESAWTAAMAGSFGLWLTYPAGALAYVILMDQFPRNMFRDTARAFESDKNARAAARIAISRDWDLAISEPARQFFYLPLEHAEAILDQDRAVRLFASRMPETGAGFLVHACAHRAIIRKFGRFPMRNTALGRESTPAETEWLAAGGYGAEVRAQQAANTEDLGS